MKELPSKKIVTHKNFLPIVGAILAAGVVVFSCQMLTQWLDSIRPPIYEREDVQIDVVPRPDGVTFFPVTSTKPVIPKSIFMPQLASQNERFTVELAYSWLEHNYYVYENKQTEWFVYWDIGPYDAPELFPVPMGSCLRFSYWPKDKSSPDQLYVYRDPAQGYQYAVNP